MYQQKKTDYQRGYEDGEELIVTHVNLDGRSKAKEYIQKLADKNKGKTDALNDFINNSASYFVPPQILQEYNKSNKNNMENNKIKNKVKMTENGLKKLIKESTAKILKEMEMENVPYEAWSEYLHGKEPLFEFEDDIVYVDYDEATGCLCSGYVTNIGFHKDGEVEVPVEDGDFQSALEEVYSQLCCNHESLDENKNRKVKLTESQLCSIIKESVKRVLKEGHWK